MPDLLDELNESQREAASHTDGAMLILAGAGSGKTKTITTRLAYLISELGIPPSNTLTLTFTNKAASEMRTRALNMLGVAGKNFTPLLCTFHKFGLLFLKFEISLAKTEVAMSPSKPFKMRFLSSVSMMTKLFLRFRRSM